MRSSILKIDNFNFSVTVVEKKHFLNFSFESVFDLLNTWTGPVSQQKEFITGLFITLTPYVPHQNNGDEILKTVEKVFPCSNNCTEFSSDPQIEVHPEYSFNITVALMTSVGLEIIYEIILKLQHLYSLVSSVQVRKH